MFRIVLTGVGLHTAYLTGRCCCDCTAIPLVSICINCNFIMTWDILFTVVTVNTCCVTLCGAGSFHFCDILSVYMIWNVHTKVYGLCMFRIVLTDVGFHTAYLAGCCCCDCTIVPIVSIRINCNFSVTWNILFTIITPNTCCVSYCWTSWCNCFSVLCINVIWSVYTEIFCLLVSSIVLTGAGLHTTYFTGCCGCNCSVIPLVSICINGNFHVTWNILCTVIAVYTGSWALCCAGCFYFCNILGVNVIWSIYTEIFRLLMSSIVLTGIDLHTAYLTGCCGCNCSIIPIVSISINCNFFITWNVLLTIVAVNTCCVANSRTCSIYLCNVLDVNMIWSINAEIVCLLVSSIVLTGVGLHTAYLTGCCGCNCTVIPLMSISINCNFCVSGNIILTVITVNTVGVTYCGTCCLYFFNITYVLMSYICSYIITIVAFWITSVTVRVCVLTNIIIPCSI